jgi:hypothetical protein
MPTLDVTKRWKRKRRKAHIGKTTKDGILRPKVPTMLYGIRRLRKKRNSTKYDYNHCEIKSPRRIMDSNELYPRIYRLCPRRTDPCHPSPQAHMDDGWTWIRPILLTARPLPGVRASASFSSSLFPPLFLSLNPPSSFLFDNYRYDASGYSQPAAVVLEQYVS